MSPLFLSLSAFCDRYDLKVNSVRSGLKRQPESWPPYLKVGNFIRFRITDIHQWEEKNMN
ncbi:hypothetical protein OA79_07570 [Marinomonas sp. TW1]|nr:hypothetical protein OA79_07570 [Marinomonas sp. TW1]